MLHKLADLELQVHDGFLSDGQVDAGADDRLETGLFRFQFLLADGQGEHVEVAISIADYGSGGAGFDAFHCDGHAADSGAASVVDAAGDFGGHLSPQQRRRE